MEQQKIQVMEKPENSLDLFDFISERHHHHQHNHHHHHHHHTSFFQVMEKPENSLDLFDFISERGVSSEAVAKAIFQQVRA